MLLWCHYVFFCFFLGAWFIFNVVGLWGWEIRQIICPRTYPIGVCVYESEREREKEREWVLSVWSGKCMQQDRLPNIGWVRQTEAAAYSLLKTSGNTDFCAWRWRKWLEFCQTTTAPASDTGWKAAGWLFLFTMISPSKIMNKTFASDLNCSLAHELLLLLLLGCFWNVNS